MHLFLSTRSEFRGRIASPNLEFLGSLSVWACYIFEYNHKYKQSDYSYNNLWLKPQYEHELWWGFGASKFLFRKCWS